MANSTSVRVKGATVVQRLGDVVYVDNENGLRLRGALKSHRDMKNAADKAATEVQKVVNSLIDDAMFLVTEDGEGLFYIQLANRAPAVDWDTLEADLQKIGKTRADYEVEQEPVRRLMISPASTTAVVPVVTEDVIPMQIVAPTALDTVKAKARKGSKK